MSEEVTDVQDIGIFSDRSPRSRAQEKRLQEEADKIAQYISRLEGELEGMEKDRSRMVRLIALGEVHSMSQSRLDECVRLIHDTRDNLEALKKERAKTEQEIAAFSPSPAQSQARSAEQLEFTELAKKRFAKTKEVEALLQQFRRALRERIELAGKMRQIAEGLDCEIIGDALDEGRFEHCFNSLPDDLLAESERWQSALGLN